MLKDNAFWIAKSSKSETLLATDLLLAMFVADSTMGNAAHWVVIMVRFVSK